MNQTRGAEKSAERAVRVGRLAGRCALARLGLLASLVTCGCSDEAPTTNGGSDAVEPQRDGGGETSTAKRDAGRPEAAARPDAGSTACNRVELSFDAREPTVVILVDRSSSMFEQNLWQPLKEGVLESVARLQSEVRFGFASYTGQQGGTCPEVTSVAATGTGNLPAIQAAYDALGAPPYKGETPTSLAIAQIAAQLEPRVDEAAGPRFILLVTDGEPDFCDDGNVVCARDAVVAAAQQAHARGVGTLVFHVGGGVDRQHLEDVARAGIGETVADRGGAVAQQCATPRASYSRAGGAGVLFEPDVSDRDALVSALSAAVAGLRSCTFDLRGELKIDPDAAHLGSVEIDGVSIPLDDANGYRFNGPSELELRGEACARLRRPAVSRVRFDFPCEAIVVI